MEISPDECCVLDGADGSWAFAPLAEQLSAGLGVQVSSAPRRFNYALTWRTEDDAALCESFIPRHAIEIAADKRELARVFAEGGVPTPETALCETLALALRHAEHRPEKSWCLKYPTGCGGSGHRMLFASTRLPETWPQPLVVQEFVQLEHPEVFRTYVIGGEIYGWVVRRIPSGERQTPWVAHARGARYFGLEGPPAEANAAALAAIRACGLEDSFGCVDLLCAGAGKWLVLETGTDGVFNHVDRELGDPELEREILARIAQAFWRKAGRR